MSQRNLVPGKNTWSYRGRFGLSPEKIRGSKNGSSSPVILTGNSECIVFFFSDYDWICLKKHVIKTGGMRVCACLCTKSLKPFWKVIIFYFAKRLGYDVSLNLIVLGFSVHSLNLVSATQLGEVDSSLAPFKTHLMMMKWSEVINEGYIKWTEVHKMNEISSLFKKGTCFTFRHYMGMNSQWVAVLQDSSRIRV